MQIRFAKKKLQKTCNEMGLLIKEFGADNARVIARRLTALGAYPALADVPTTPPERCHPLKGDRKGEFAVELQGGFRIVFEPDHDPLPRTRNGGLDLRAITDICILDITDYH